MRVNDLSREELFAKYKKVNYALRTLIIISLVSTVMLCFVPEWILDWILATFKKGKGHVYKRGNRDPSWFSKDGFESVFIMLGIFATAIIVIALIINWLGLYRRARELKRTT